MFREDKTHLSTDSRSKGIRGQTKMNAGLKNSGGPGPARLRGLFFLGKGFYLFAFKE